MEREDNSIDLIDLGAASVETQGPGGTEFDGIDLQVPAGLSDD